MIKSLYAAVVAVLGIGLIAAAPASAASTSPSGAGYLTSPAAFHSARVTVRVPTLRCSTSGPARGVRLGLFVEVRTDGKPVATSLIVDASCQSGVTQYKATYDGDTNGAMRVHHGDHVVLELSGTDANSYSIEDRTTGEGGGGGSAGPGPTPQSERHVLIGTQVTGAAPSVHATFEGAKVNRHPLADVAHHRQGRTHRTHVGTLRGSAFTVRLGLPKH